MSPSIDDHSPIGILLIAQRDMYDELKQHRTLFSDIKDSISDQKRTYASLATSIDNLAASIDRHEHIVEKVLAIENWKVNTRLEERIVSLEMWRTDADLSSAHWKGRFVILAAFGAVVTSAGVYVIDTLVKEFLIK